MTDLEPILNRYHSLYCRLTNRPFRFDMPKHFQWHAWTVNGWTEDDLATVIKYIQWQIRIGKRRLESLHLHLLLDPQRFEDDLHDARVLARKPRPATVMKEQSINGANKLVRVPRPERTPEQIMAGMKAAEEFSKLKEVL